MKREIINLIKEELVKHEANLEQFKGGMDQYKNSLEDSDTFYNEASTLGSIETLKSLLVMIEDLATDDNLTSSDAKVKTVVYRPAFDKLPNYASYEISNVWLNKEALETSLNSDAIDISFIEKINTNELDCYPILVDSNDYVWDVENQIFKLRDEKYLKNIIGKNADLIVQNPERILMFLFGDNVGHDCSCLDGDGNSRYYMDCYFFNFRGNKYHIEIKNNKDIKLMREDENGWDLILTYTTINQYSIVELNSNRILITVSKDILDEFYNEIISDIVYNLKDNSSGNSYVTVENNRFGFEINDFRIEYKWMLAEYDYIKINDVDFEICGANKLDIARIYSDKFWSENELLSSLLDYCRGKGIVIEPNMPIEYKLIENKYVAKLDEKFYIADNAEGLNSTLLEYLPSGIEMQFLNALNKSFDIHLKVWDFKNDSTTFEEKLLVKFKEGADDDSEGVCYVISNLVTEITLGLAVNITNKIWSLIDVNDETSTFEDFSKIISNEFGMDLYEILEDEWLPNNWYPIFEKVLFALNVEFQNIKEKTIVI